jgi:hypothetical protein
VKLTSYLHPMPRIQIHGAVILTPPYDFVAWSLIEHTENLNFTFENYTANFIIHRVLSTLSVLNILTEIEPGFRKRSLTLKARELTKTCRERIIFSL